MKSTDDIITLARLSPKLIVLAAEFDIDEKTLLEVVEMTHGRLTLQTLDGEWLIGETMRIGGDKLSDETRENYQQYLGILNSYVDNVENQRSIHDAWAFLDKL